MANTIIFDIQVDKDALNLKLTETNKEIRANQEEIKKLSKDYNANADQITKLSLVNDDLRGKSRAYQKEIKTETGSLNQLRSRLAELTKQRNAENLATTQGKKNAEELNKSILSLTDSIKEQEEAGGDFRRSVGDYKTAIDGLIPSLGGFASGIGKMTMQSLRFIATPLGAVIGAIGLAVAALTKYFQSSEEGQNKWNKIVKVSEVLLNNFYDILADIGEFLFDTLGKAFEDPIGSIKKLGDVILENVINRFKSIAVFGEGIAKLFKGDISGGFKTLGDAAIQLGTGITNGTDKIVAGANAAANAIKSIVEETEREIGIASRLADLQAKIDRAERKLLVDTARLRSEIEENKLKAVDKERFTNEERLKFLQEANAIEIDLANRSEAIAKDKLTLIREENKLSKSNKEALQAEAEAEANLLSIQGASATKRKELKSQELAIQNEIIAAKQKEIDLENQKNAALLTASQQLSISRKEIAIKNETDAIERARKEIELEQEKTQILLDNDQLLADERTRIEEETAQRIVDINIQAQDEIEASLKDTEEERAAVNAAAIEAAAALFGQLSTLAEENSSLQKGLAVTQAIINAYVGFTAALKNPYPLNIIAAASTLAAGLGAVTKIKGFATGGVISDGQPIRRSNGDDVLITAKRGEVILNKRQQSIIGSDAFTRAGVPGFADGGIVTNEITRPELNSIQQFNNMPIQVSVTEINNVQRKVDVIERSGEL